MKLMLMGVLLAGSLVSSMALADDSATSNVQVINPTAAAGSTVKTKASDLSDTLDFGKIDLKIGLGISGSAKNRHAQISRE